MADVGFTINVLGFGELYWQVFNAISSFVYSGEGLQAGFNGLLKLTGLIGIVMASVGYLKQRDPMVYAKWVLSYVLVLQLVIMPKTTIEIYDISAQKSTPVANVPVIFALTASLITNVGVGLAESYDSLFSTPGDLRYTQTGSLFGSKMIQAARDFHIVNPQLKAEMNAYVRNCVIGDITLNNKYTVESLGNSKEIWELITSKPSPVRMTEVNGQLVTCEKAVSPGIVNNLRYKLNAEIENAYTIFGVNLFGKPEKIIEAELFKTRLKSVFDYYKLMTDSSEDIMLQSMMINAVNEGIRDYQAYTGATAGIVNNQMNKSQMQHRFAWAIMGQKAAWFLPILHTLLTVLLVSLFPLVIAMSTMPNGAGIFRGYIQFFVSLQFWPVLFAVLNLAMTMYAQNKTASFGGISIVNIDKIDELHGDLAGVAGYLMLMIPFIAKGLVSNLSEAFNNLATSMTGHVQSSAMAVASEAASASFSLGQTHVNNASANTFSANKHDNNWTNMHGMRTEQLATGVLKTTTASRDTVFDVSPGMTKSTVSINSSDSIMGSFNEAAEESKQAGINAHQSLQTSVTNAAHKALLLSQLKGHDMRLGEGVSQAETSQYQDALSTAHHIASDVAKREGISEDESLARLVRGSVSGSLKLPSMLARSVRMATGGFVNLDGSLSADYSRSSTSTDKSNEGIDTAATARETNDFNNAFTYIQNFVKTHHFDDNQSEGANLSNQLGSDLRNAEVASQNLDASITKGQRISEAKSYVKSQGDQITKNLEQEFPAFVEAKVGKRLRDALFSHPGDSGSNQRLQQLGKDFIRQERDAIVASFDKPHQQALVDKTYQAGAHQIKQQATGMNAHYINTTKAIEKDAKHLNLGIDPLNIQNSKARVGTGTDWVVDSIDVGGEVVRAKEQQMRDEASHRIPIGIENAKRGAILTLGRNNDDTKEK